VRELSIDTPRGLLAAAVTGSGPPVVLVAGLGSTRARWGDLPAVLGRRFTVISFDNRGVGGSRLGAPFNLEGAAADVAAVIEAAAEEQRASLLGVSMGGAIALAASLAQPQLVSRLVLASAAAHLSSHGLRSLTLLRDLLRHLPPARVGPALMTLVFSPPFHERFPGFVDQAAALYGIDPLDAPGALAQVESLLEGWDLRPRLGTLTIPALVLAGTRDPVVAAEDTAELATLLPQAELLTVPDAAHSLLAEGGAGLLERVSTFLSAMSPENPEAPRT
jgi:pimeloyl-ACP methyl ester carboxylesterase